MSNEIDGFQLMSDFNFTSKYARYLDSEKRREVWEESIDRVRNMHLRKYIGNDWKEKDSKLKNDIIRAFDMSKEKRVLGSQRALQFGGKGVEKHNARSYNCSFSYVDRPEVFGEIMYLLLCGVGVGFSVQNCHVSRLPDLISEEELDNKTPKVFVADDSIEGWGHCVDVLCKSFWEGFEESKHEIVFDLSNIRPKGAPLSTGGKAPGPEPLRKALEHIREIFKQAVRSERDKLKPIECHDIICHASDSVLAGGIRRSACISLFDLEDDEMRLSKTGNWTNNNPQRARANNSAVLLRSMPEEELLPKFKKIMKACREFGEPGFFFTDSYNYGINPCAEILLNSTWIGRPTDIDPDDINYTFTKPYERISINGEDFYYYCKGNIYEQVDDISLDMMNNRDKYEDQGYHYATGFSFCNLTEINASDINSKKDFKEAVWAATLIGTLQAGYTDFSRYLTEVSEWIAEREALLGVSMTGIMDNPTYALDPELQVSMAHYAIEVNQAYSGIIGIREAARVTAVKPAGNSSVILKTSSGIHPHHANRFIRRVQVVKNDNVYNHFKNVNPHICEESVWSANDSDDVISFPIEINNPDAITKQELNSVELLERVLSTQVNWVMSGTARPESSEGAFHNVSNTIHVDSDMWMDVGKFIFKNRDCFTAVSLLGASGDKIYQQAPFEKILFKDELIEKHGYSNYCKAKYLYDRILEKQKKRDKDRIQSLHNIIHEYSNDSNASVYNEEIIEKLLEDIDKLSSKNYTIHPYISPVIALFNGSEDWESSGITKDHYEVFLEIKTVFNDWNDGDAIMNLIASVYDEEKWKVLNKNLDSVDYTKLIESEDNTKIQQTVACSGGQCDIL